MPSSAALQPAFQSGADQRIGADDRLLIEAMLAHDRLSETSVDDPAADDAARQADGNPEHLLAVRARSLRNVTALNDALRHVRQVMGLLITACAVLALAGGAAAARAALGAPRTEPVNFFHLIGILLGLQTLLLLIWLYLLLFARRSATVAMAAASLGGLIMALARRLVQWTHKGREHTAAIAAVSSMLMRGSSGKWTFSAISNGLWLAFNVGCLAMVVALLSTRQYTFAWETTILSSSAYVPLTNAVSIVPAAAGFTVPSDAQIKASQWNGESGPFSQSSEASRAWSSLLVGSLIVYGFGPRLLLLALSLGKRRVARRAYRVDVNQLEAARILERLAPTSNNLGIVDGDDDRQHPQAHVDSPIGIGSRPIGSPAIVAFEIERPATPWPPQAPALKWDDLGFVDGRDDRHRVLLHLRGASSQPKSVVIACGLANTPDRGAESFLRELVAASSAPLVMLLTGGQNLRERADVQRIEQRIADWRSIAASAGISSHNVIELDLDHVTRESLARLGLIIIGPAGAAATHQRQLERAFGLIDDFAQRVEGQPNKVLERERLALHQDIAALFRSQQDSWLHMLRVPKTIGANLSLAIKDRAPGDLVKSMHASAARFTQLLPERLKRSPRWLASGAAVGALGCIAAAAMISPVAIGALPMWSAIGAAIAAAIQLAPRASSTQDTPTDHSALDDGVRAAALFALVLELQGRDEVAITRILDATIPDDELSTIVTAANARIWLADVRHRFDLALASEAAR